MKAAVFYGRKNLVIEELPVPEPGKGELLIQVMACGVCGTDIHIFNGDEGAAKTPSGTVLGHEFAGLVVRGGEGTEKFRPGDRVCIDPNRLCGECGPCRSGLGHFCENIVGIGTTVNGGFAEYCVVPQSQAYPFGETLRFTQAAMTEPTACCLHGIDMCDIACGDTVAVIGGGMIGLLMLQLARLRGAKTLILIEPVAEKRALAKQLGADLVLDPFEGEITQALEAAGVGRIATVIECVGKTATMEQAIAIAGQKSTVMLFGLTAPEDVLSVKPFTLFKKEIVLKASYINPYTQQRALGLLESGRLDVSSMIREVIPLSELPALLANKEALSKGKYIVNPQA